MKPFVALLSAITLAGTLVACPNTTTVPGFDLNISPADLTLAAGASGAATLTVTPKNGFSGAVSFVSSDAIVGSGPDKIALDAPAISSGTRTMSIIVGANVPAQRYDLTIRGLAGNLTQSVALALTVTAVTPPAPSAPANPSGFTATSSSSSAITLTWTVAATATGYNLERKSGAEAYAVIATPPSNGYVDAGLTPATAYTYRLKAVNAGGSSTGVEASAVTLVAPATTVFKTDFEAGMPAAITPLTALIEGVQSFAGLGTPPNTFSGSFLRSATGNVVRVSLTNLPAHTSLSLGFLLAAIDSLDGSGAFPAGDFFNVKLDGVSIFRESFANATDTQIQSYAPAAGVELARRVDLGFVVGYFFLDSAYDLYLEPRFQNIPHTASALELTFEFEGEGNQSLSDESWAMDNLEIKVNP